MDPTLHSADHRRVLVVDDTPSVHRDFLSLLREPPVPQNRINLVGLSMPAPNLWPAFNVDFALQGMQAREKVLLGLLENQPYTVAFVDLHMPPGWDGITTAKQLWQVDPRLQIILFSARDEISLDDLAQLGDCTQNVFILRKPIDPTSARQMAVALSERWRSAKQANVQLDRQEGELRQLSAILGATGVPMVVSLPTGTVTWANATAQALFSLGASNLGSVILEWFVHPQDAPKLRETGIQSVRLRSTGSHATATVSTSLLQPELGLGSPRLHTLLLASTNNSTKNGAAAGVEGGHSAMDMVGLSPIALRREPRTCLDACAHEASAACVAAMPNLRHVALELGPEPTWTSASPQMAVEELVETVRRGLHQTTLGTTANGPLTMTLTTLARECAPCVRVVVMAQLPDSRECAILDTTVAFARVV